MPTSSPIFASQTAELQAPGAYVFWAAVVKTTPVLELATSYAYPEIVLNAGDQVTFLLPYDIPTGPLLAYVDFSPTYPIQIGGQWGVTSGQMVAGVWYSLQFEDSYWILVNPSTPVPAQPVAIPPPEPLPSVEPPMNVSLLTGGYVLPQGASAYVNFSSAAMVNLNVETDLVAQAQGVYEVTLAGNSSGTVQYVPGGESSGTVMPSGYATQSFIISLQNSTINSQSFTAPVPQVSLGSLLFSSPQTGSVIVRRLL